ncbi:MAG: hypothetical protein IJD58_11840 [Lachnospiraceae bacterium]|nr:hypothetical protein [Lachnospiraceae bacterium]
MKTVANNPINISKGSKGGYVEEQLINCVKDIIAKVRMEFDVEYKDVTYKDLYMKTVQFAKEIDEVLSAEISQRDDMFDSTPDFFSFRNDKLV